MSELKKHIYDEKNGLHYTLVEDYYIPDLKLPEESRPIGKYGRIHRDYLKEHQSIRYNDLVLSGKLWTVLADLNEQAHDRLGVIKRQMMEAEGVTEQLKAADQMEWVRRRYSVHNRAEEIVLHEMIYC